MISHKQPIADVWYDIAVGSKSVATLPFHITGLMCFYQNISHAGKGNLFFRFVNLIC